MAEKTTKKKVTTKAPKTAVTKAEKAPKRSTGTRTAKAATASTPAKIERTRVKEERPTEERVETQPATENKAVRVKKSYFFTVLGIVLLVLLAVLFRNLFVAAMVNNHPISRLAVISELEKQGGKQTLESLITKSLIVQEADKRHIEISQKDIDGEIKKIQNNLASQGQTLEQVLQLQNMTKDQLVEQIKLQKMIEKMVKPAAVTDKDVDDYVTANKDSLPQDQDEATLKKSIKDRLQQQRLNDEAQKFLDGLRKNAKIDYFVNY